MMVAESVAQDEAAGQVCRSAREGPLGNFGSWSGLLGLDSLAGGQASSGDFPLRQGGEQRQEESQVLQVLLVVALSAIAAACWLLGVALPVVVIHPLPFGNDAVPETIHKSTLTTIQALFEGRHYLAFCILSCCSVMVPFAKAVVTVVAVLSPHIISLPPTAERCLQRSISVLAALSSYQCVDLLVGILFVAFLHDGILTARLDWGFAFFAAYCGISQALLLRLQKRVDMRTAPVGGSCKDSPTPALEANLSQVSVMGAIMLILAILASVWPMLDVSIIYEDFFVGRTRLGLLGIALTLADEGGPCIGVLLMLSFLTAVVVFPLLVVGLVLAAELPSRMASQPCTARSEDPRQSYLWLAKEISHWALPDVFALAMVTFMFTMHDGQVITSVPPESTICANITSFHMGLALGAAGCVIKSAVVQSSNGAYDELVDSDDGLQSQNWDAEDCKADTDKTLAIVGDAGRSLPFPSWPPAEPSGKRKCPPELILGSPPLRLRTTSMIVPWIVWLAACICIHMPAQHQPFVHINDAFPRLVELLNNMFESRLPASVGDCLPEAEAPLPCHSMDGPLYESEEGQLGVDVLVRWATGVNTVRLTEAGIRAAPGAAQPIELVLEGVIRNVSLSIQINKCFMSTCDTLFDNTDGCCEPNRKVRLVAATACTDGPEGAELEAFSLKEVVLDEVKLRESIFGLFTTNVADLTPRVKDLLEGRSKAFLEGRKLVFGLTINELVSRLWRYNVEGGDHCSNLLDSMADERPDG